MATLTTVAIANKALILCGANTITALTSDTQNARTVNAIYEMTLKDVLTECRWAFATTRSTLATVATTTIAWYHSNEAYVYTKPSSALRIFELSDEDAEWREEGDYIIADTASLGAKYVYYNDDPSKYPHYFVEAFVDRLCADISFMVLNSVQKAEAFLEKYHKVSLPKAMAENSQIGTNQIVTDDAWENSKYQNESPAA